MNLFCLLFLTAVINAQTDSIYLFYLHGRIVQSQGADAISPLYGPYKYTAIVDSLKQITPHVISEVRPKKSDVSDYAEKVSYQIDSLINRGVEAKKIVVVGASLGAYITIELATRLKNKELNYVLLGLCSAYAINYYQPIQKKLRGHFLSIYESSDEKKSCDSLLLNAPLSSYQEIRLEMGLGHGFLYQPYPEWTQPLHQWIINRSK